MNEAFVKYGNSTFEKYTLHSSVNTCLMGTILLDRIVSILFRRVVTIVLVSFK